MIIDLYQVDAFTDKNILGNPAAVCPLDEWLEDEALQSIAFKNNLSETAFFVREGVTYRLRWFTPTTEVDLCGHATLASAYVLFEHLKYKGDKIIFNTKSGELTVDRRDDEYVLNFPQLAFQSTEILDLHVEILGEIPIEIYSVADHTLMAVLKDEDGVKKLAPDIHKLLKLQKTLIVTAKSESVDFVSRCFCPHEGIDEDPVTGSAHCYLGPYWAEQFSKKQMVARQLSKRGGTLKLSLMNSGRIEIAGKAVLYMKGEITNVKEAS